MHLWQQTSAYNSSTSNSDSFVADNEKLNNNSQFISETATLYDLTFSLNFARPEPSLSHTAATTLERRIERDRALPRLRTINNKNLSNIKNLNNMQPNNSVDSPKNSWIPPAVWWPNPEQQQQPKTRLQLNALAQAHDRHSTTDPPRPDKYIGEKSKPGVHRVNRVSWAMDYTADRTQDVQNHEREAPKYERPRGKWQVENKETKKETKLVGKERVPQPRELKQPDHKQTGKPIDIINSINNDNASNGNVLAPPESNKKHNRYSAAYFSAPPDVGYFGQIFSQRSSMEVVDDVDDDDGDSDVVDQETSTLDILSGGNLPSPPRPDLSRKPVHASNSVSTLFTSTKSVSSFMTVRNSNSNPNIDPPSNHSQSISTKSTLTSSLTSISSPQPTATFTPSEPPSLSPCSSASSLNSSVDMLTPAHDAENHKNRHHKLHVSPTNKQSNHLDFSVPKPHAAPRDAVCISPHSYAPPNPNPNPFMGISLGAASLSSHMFSHQNQSFNPRQKSKSLPASAPVTSQSYSDVPWSPAVSFLSGLADATVHTPLPDDEGQQVGEYILGKVIGRGGFSTVREAYTMDSGGVEKVAVKIVRNNTESKDNDRVQQLVEREISIWRELEHPNVVPFISVEETDYATFIFSEYCSDGTLLQYIKKRNYEAGRGLDEDEARVIFAQIAEAVRFLHNDMRLVHKDIKLDNILLGEEETWKLCDFGLTEFQNADENGFANLSSSGDAGGSLAYCPPEQLRTQVPLRETSVDIWSLGVVLYALMTGQLPFNDDFEPRLQYKILNGRFDETPLRDINASDDLRELLRGMFKTKPSLRFTITDVLESEWCKP